MTPNSSVICWLIFNSPSLWLKMCINFMCLFDSGSSRQILQRSKFSLCKCICESLMMNGSSGILRRQKAENQTIRRQHQVRSGDRQWLMNNVVNYERWDQWQPVIINYWFSTKCGLVKAVNDIHRPPGGRHQFSWPNAQTRRTDFRRLTSQYRY